MPKILKISRPGDYLEYVGAKTTHPLVGVVDYEEVSPVHSSLNSYEVYGIFVHSNVRDDLTYGIGAFGHATGSLICVGPGQIGGREDDGSLINLDGYVLLFHPDLLIGTSLEKKMGMFTFFDYSANEALYMDEDDKAILVALIKNIREEAAGPADSEQAPIIVSYISAMLHLCKRAYDRQFSRLRQTSDDILVKLSTLLNEYFESGKQLTGGIPGIQYFADKLCMSPNYFSDMFKRTTGESVGNFIRNNIIRIAKNRLAASGNVTEVAYGLGFEYPQHFSRMFRKHTGKSPSQYLKALK